MEIPFRAYLAAGGTVTLREAITGREVTATVSRFNAIDAEVIPVEPIADPTTWRLVLLGDIRMPSPSVPQPDLHEQLGLF
jgi:hypothetical protein